MADEETEYNVELLKAIKRVSNDPDKSGLRVLIKWEGYPESENTWEPIENLNPISAVRMLKDLGKELGAFPKCKKLIQDAIQVWYAINDPGGDDANLERLMSPPSNDGEKKATQKRVKYRSLVENAQKAPRSRGRPSQKKTDKSVSQLSRDKSDGSVEPTSALNATTDFSLPATNSKPTAETAALSNDNRDEFVINKKKALIEYSHLAYNPTLNQFFVTRSEIDPTTKILRDTKTLELFQEFNNEKISQKALFAFVVEAFVDREHEFGRLSKRLVDMHSKNR